MRIIATSDLHISPITEERIRNNARRAEDEGTRDDVLVIAGDLTTAIRRGEMFTVDDDDFHKCLGYFEGFPGKRLVVPGNHDLWVTNGQSSIDRYNSMPAIFGEHGFHMLDHSPVVIGGVGFVGNVGWYDYSFRRPDRPLGDVKLIVDGESGPEVKEWEELTAGDYARKFVKYFVESELPPNDVLMRNPERYLRYAGWNDGVFIKWADTERKFLGIPLGRKYTDESFLGECVRNLERDLRRVNRQSDQIVVVTHHLPFREMVEMKGEPSWDFNNAYMGSQRMGEAIRKYPKVSTVIAAHVHKPGQYDVDGIKCYNVSRGKGGGITIIEPAMEAVA
jgi:Icc-related predicted phosphoesterase